MKTRGPAASSVEMGPQVAQASGKTGPPASQWDHQPVGSPARDPGLARTPSTGAKLLWELRARQGLRFLFLVQALGEIFQGRDLQVTLIIRKLQGGKGEKTMYSDKGEWKCRGTWEQNADLEESRKMLLLLLSQGPLSLRTGCRDVASE